MGTQLRIVAVGDCDSVGAAIEDAFAAAQWWDTILNHYQPQSALSRLNAAAGSEIEIPPALDGYLRRAQADAQRTHAVFDITIGPLVRLYHDGSPTPEAVSAALALVGWDGVALRRDGDHHFAKLRTGMALDPGGDGKGVAVDAMVAVLRNAGIRRAFIDFGGSSFFGLGSPVDTGGWNVVLVGSDGQPLGTVALRDRALSSSSSYLRDLADESTGEEIWRPHIVDPRNGQLIEVRRTVAAIAQSATTAEVLSTALVVVADGGFEWLEDFEGAAVGVFQNDASPRFAGGLEVHFQPTPRVD